MTVTAGASVHPSRAAWVSTGLLAQISSAATLGAALVEWADERPDDPACYVYELSGACTELTVGALRDLAAGAAAVLADHGVMRGDPVGISLETSPELLAAVFGAALLGAVPFVLEPPFTGGRGRIWAERVAAAIERTRPPLLVVNETAHRHAQSMELDVRLLQPPFPASAMVPDPPVDPDDVAYLQFTSGTLGHAKAATITHRALFANVAAIGAAGPFLTDDLVVSWLPLHHDMGLVGVTFSALLHRIPVVLMPPMAFIARPERWLWAVHRFRATLSSAPNFGYQMCAAKVSDAALTGLDLSSWRIACNGAEVVNIDTLRQWQQRFGRYGVRPESMRPCYGMAELAVAATFSAPGTVPRVEHIDRDVLARAGIAVAVSSDHPRARPIASVGRPLPGYDVAVVDEAGTPVASRTQGNIVVRGPSMMTGYHRDSDATAHALRDGRLQTGDLGFMVDDELFVTGRAKDLVVVAGRNYHPYPAETAASAVPGVRPGGVAVVGVPDPVRGTEALAVVVESATAGRLECVRELGDAVDQAVTAELGLRPSRVVVVRPGRLARTPSGKLQRSRIVADLLAGRIESSGD